MNNCKDCVLRMNVAYFLKMVNFCKWIDKVIILKLRSQILSSSLAYLIIFLLVCCVYTNSEESLLYYSFKQKCVIRFINTYYYLLLQKTKWCVYYKNTRILLVTLLSPILNLYNTCLKFLIWTSYNLSIIFLHEPYNVPTILLIHEPKNVPIFLHVPHYVPIIFLPEPHRVPIIFLYLHEHQDFLNS